MTLVTLGLLLGMAALLWILVIAIVQADHQANSKKSARGESAGRGGSMLWVKGRITGRRTVRRKEGQES